MSECSSSPERSLEKMPTSFNSLRLETAPDLTLPLQKCSKVSTYTSTSKRNEKNQLCPPSPRNEKSFLKAAIFCNMKNQVKNASELEIKIPHFPKLNKRSCSESMIQKVEHLFLELGDNDDAGSEDICDENLDIVCLLFCIFVYTFYPNRNHI